MTTGFEKFKKNACTLSGFNMAKIFRVIVFSFLSCVVLQNVCAQQSGAMPKVEIREMPFESEEIRNAYMANIISSKDGKSVIPDNAYYSVIFRRFQQRAPDFLTDEDLRIVRDLPSHEDEKFERPVIENTLVTCKRLLNSGNVDIVDVAAEWDDIRIANDASLDAHYRNVVKSLSATAQSNIAEIKNRLVFENTIGYSSFSMAGFAADMPDVTQGLLEKGCKGILDDENFFPHPKSLKMVDEVYDISPFGE